MKRVVFIFTIIVAAVLVTWLAQRPARTGISDAPPGVAAGQPVARTLRDTGLVAQLQALVERAPARCAIAAKDLSTGAFADVNADTPIALMSVVKLPIALVVLDGVDHGRWTLDSTMTLLKGDLHPRGWIGDRYPRGGPVRLYVLLREMLTRSDNSAADALLRLVGGPDTVTHWLREHGIEGLRVDRSERAMGNDWYGLAPGADTMGSAEEIRELRARVPDAVHEVAARQMLSDPRDTGTPNACVRLLERTWRGELLSPAMTDTLKSVLARCKTAPGRLPALLPKGTPVARKTGTSGMTAGVSVAINDVGVIRLPNGHDVAIAVLVGEPRGPVHRADLLIARVARTVFDAWSDADSVAMP